MDHFSCTTSPLHIWWAWRLWPSNFFSFVLFWFAYFASCETVFKLPTTNQNNIKTHANGSKHEKQTLTGDSPNSPWSSRHVSTRHVRRVERVELCLIDHGWRRTSYSARLYKFSRLCSYKHKSYLFHQLKYRVAQKVVTIKLSKNCVKSYQYYPSVLNILCLTYFLTPITMPDLHTCITYGKWCQRSLWHRFDLASC